MAKGPGVHKLTVVLLEALSATTYICEVDRSGAVADEQVDEWDTSEYLTDVDGNRLVEEIGRHISHCWKRRNESSVSGVAITLPGTLAGDGREIVSSSRLEFAKGSPSRKSSRPN